MKLTFNSAKDIFFIGWFGAVIAILGFFAQSVFQLKETNDLLWLFLVVGVDVSHVYSTLYKTYFKTNRSRQLNFLLITLPIISFFIILFLVKIDIHFFWRCLAYMAVFHFSRQQIGMYQITSGAEKNRLHTLNRLCIYFWTLGSILLWHLKGPQEYNWFVKDDFYYLTGFQHYSDILKIGLLISFSVVCSLNIYFLKKNRITFLQLGLLFSTFLTWFVPVAYFDSDFIFTWTNVLAHGVPYMYLVHKNEQQSRSYYSRWDIFILIILICSLVEEAFWDALVWREHAVFFSSFYFIPQIQSQNVLPVVLALLVTPQLTHYLLDGFIWKKKYWL